MSTALPTIPPDNPQRTLTLAQLDKLPHIGLVGDTYFVGQVASRAKAAAFIPEYGLAPEHPFPAAVNASLAAYHGLVANGLTKISLARPDAIDSRNKCKAISVSFGRRVRSNPGMSRRRGQRCAGGKLPR